VQPDDGDDGNASKPEDDIAHRANSRFRSMSVMLCRNTIVSRFVRGTASAEESSCQIRQKRAAAIKTAPEVIPGAAHDREPT